jgi:hypothetical protein
VLKKTITYTDFNGDEVTEDHFFHLTKAELVELELSHKGGLEASLKRIIADEDGKAVIEEVKNIILSSYGKRSDDGRRFIKREEFREEFESSEAYSTLFMELVLDATAAADFVNGIVPQGMIEEAAKQAKQAGLDSSVTPIVVVESPVLLHQEPEPEPETVTRRQMESMSAEDMWAMGSRIQKGEVQLLEEGTE